MTKFSHTLALLLAGGGLCAQMSVGLQALSDSLRANNPNLRNLALEVEAAQVRNRPAAGFGTIGIGYTYGQLDGLIDNDFQLQSTLSLGNPWAGIENRKLQKLEGRSAELNLALQEAFLNSELWQAYATWQAFNEIATWRQSQKEALQKALTTARRQEAAGQISPVEVSFVQGNFLQALEGQQEAQGQIENARSRLERLCRCNLQGLQPQAQNPLLGAATTNAADSSRSLYEEYFASASAAAQGRYQRQKAGLFPSLNASYIALRNDGIPDLQAVAVGVQIPLSSVSAHRDKRLAELEWQQSQLRQEQNNFARKSQLDALYKQLKFNKEKIESVASSVGTSGEVEAMQMALLRFEKGESDALALGQSIKAIAEGAITRQLLLLRYQLLSAQIYYLNTPLSL